MIQLLHVHDCVLCIIIIHVHVDNNNDNDHNEIFFHCFSHACLVLSGTLQLLLLHVQLLIVLLLSITVL